MGLIEASRSAGGVLSDENDARRDFGMILWLTHLPLFVIIF